MGVGCVVRAGIAAFFRSHTCNDVCRCLKLENNVPPGIHAEQRSLKQDV
jgi:hypothetical protein